MGLLALAVAWGVGHALVTRFGLLPSAGARIVGGLLVGVVALGTPMYLLDVAFVTTTGREWLAPTVIGLAALSALAARSDRRAWLRQLRRDVVALATDRWSATVLVVAAGLAGWVNWTTLHRTDAGDIEVVMAWSDIMYHHAYVRSIQIGSNIPIEYPYFAGHAAHYHFLFQYFTGKLAYLGLDSVHALSLMATVGLAALWFLVFELGRAWFGSAAVGLLGSLFLAFQGSLRGLAWLTEGSVGALPSRLWDLDEMLSGDAPFENWGLFNLNVFFNQRHFGFGLALLVLVVFAILSWRGDFDERPADEPRLTESALLGCFLGLLPLWHSVVTGVAGIFLFFLSLPRWTARGPRLETLTSLAVAGVLALPQLLWFKSGDSALTGYPKLRFGYALLAGSGLIDWAGYFFQTLGVETVLMVAAFLVVSWRRRFDLVVFFIPFALGNVLQFGKVLYDNNKLFFATLCFAHLFAAFALWTLGRRLGRIGGPVIVFIAFLCTASGFIDLFWIRNIQTTTVRDASSPFRSWIVANTRPDDVFLTHTYIPWHDNLATTVTLAGRPLFVVENNVDAVTDGGPHLAVAESLFAPKEESGDLTERLRSLDIDYVVFEDEIGYREYARDEDSLRASLRLVFTDPRGRVYAVE